jgi:hypothetical protein
MSKSTKSIQNAWEIQTHLCSKIGMKSSVRILCAKSMYPDTSWPLLLKSLIKMIVVSFPDRTSSSLSASACELQEVVRNRQLGAMCKQTRPLRMEKLQGLCQCWPASWEQNVSV